MQGFVFRPGCSVILFNPGVQVIQLNQQALLFLFHGGHAALKLGPQVSQLPAQTLPFLPCNRKLALDLFGRPGNTRAEPLYQISPEMLEDRHRNDLHEDLAAVIL
jgi:hypothetical protein